MKPLLLKTNVFSDERGVFFPLIIETHGTQKPWIQSNISISKKWTFRGLHHQVGNYAQSKLVTVIKGSIVDFLVDLRMGSFEEAYFFRLVPGEQVYVPSGFAHGFLALEEDTIIQYLVDNDYSPEHEISFDWKSNETIKELILAEVGDENNLIISGKDAIGIKLSKEHVETNDYSRI